MVSELLVSLGHRPMAGGFAGFDLARGGDLIKSYVLNSLCKTAPREKDNHRCDMGNSF